MKIFCLQAVVWLFIGVLLPSIGRFVVACDLCPVSIGSRTASHLDWIPNKAETCEVLAIPEVFEVPHSRWGLGVEGLDDSMIGVTEDPQRPFCIMREVPGHESQALPTREVPPYYDKLRIEEMTWDQIYRVLWGASRVVYRLRGYKARMDATRIYTIKFDSLSGYAECTYRFTGLGVPGPGFPTTGLSFDPTEGSHGTLWQHLEDGGASYTPFPIKANLGTTGPGEPVYVGGYPGHGQVCGICVSPSGKYMYVSHGIDGYISLHDKWTGALVANLASGPTVPRRYCRGMEIDYRKEGCPRLFCTESILDGDEWTPTILVTYPITDQ